MLNIIAIIISALCFVTIIGVVAAFIYRQNTIRKELEDRIAGLTQQINEVNTYKYLADREQQKRMTSFENELLSVKRNYITKKEISQGITTNRLSAFDINSTNVVAADITTKSLVGGDVKGDFITTQQITTYTPNSKGNMDTMDAEELSCDNFLTKKSTKALYDKEGPFAPNMFLKNILETNKVNASQCDVKFDYASVDAPNASAGTDKRRFTFAKDGNTWVAKVMDDPLSGTSLY
jgi:hypothetical protein